MKRKHLLWITLLLLTMACRVTLPRPPAIATPLPLPLATDTPAPPSPTPTPTLTPTPAPTATPLPQPPALLADDVLLFPAPPCPGDWLSADVTPLLPPGDAPYTVTLALPSGEVTTARVVPHHFDDTLRARFYWTGPLPESAAAITFTLEVPPHVADPNAEDNVAVIPLAACGPHPLPPEPQATWATTETAGFRLHYLTESAAERDLAELLAKAQSAYRAVTAKIGATDDPLDIYFLSRVIGQGGYAAGDWVAISYLDRNYAPGNIEMVLRHELVHWVDDAIGCKGAPSIVREGLAVMGAGGHYWPVPPEQQAAALLGTEAWIPLAVLAVDFYTHQHEIGYAEAGALLAYAREAHGWDGIAAFCRATSAEPDGPVAQMAAGAPALGYADLDALEVAWMAWLAAFDVSPEMRAQLAADVRLMDTMRAYQLRFDPTAHFLRAILFNPRAGAERGVVADFVRRPRTLDAVALEVLLVKAQDAAARRDAAAVDALLDVIEATLADGFPAQGLAADARGITAAALARGYEPYRMEALAEGGYRVHAVSLDAWPQREQFVARYTAHRWDIQIEEAR